MGQPGGARRIFPGRVTPHSEAPADGLMSLEGSKVQPTERKIMLYTLAVVLIVLWLLGMVTSYTIGGFIHILLAIAIIMILVNLISGRRPVL
jgi:hypothetical protein